MKRTLLLFAAALPLACSRPQGLGPPEIVLGQTDCAQCGMTVGEERYAAGLVLETPAGERVDKVFDDIGCMSAFVQSQHEGKVLARYVKDFNTRQWLAADGACYVRGDGIRSPMGYGFAAFRKKADAQSFGAAKSATVLSTPATDARPEPSASAR